MEDVVLVAALLVVERSIVPSLVVGVNVDSLGVMEVVAWDFAEEAVVYSVADLDAELVSQLTLLPIH